jgi:putative tricarboxylic transport membrane protein
MFQGLLGLGQSLAGFLTPQGIFFVLAATLVGTLIGALPGLTATMGVALMTTLTLQLPPSYALLVLICTYVGAIYGGSRSAILLNIPGTPASAAACMDGFALSRQGMAGRAMGIATSGSVLGTMVGVLCLALFTPLLGDMALKFGAYEFFWLAVFGVIISATLTGPDALKGWIAGFAGLFVATIGQDGIHAFERFNFGNRDLAGGISLVPALVGAFGFAEILVAMQERRPPVKVSTLDSVIPKIRHVLQYWRTIIRSGLIGTFMGLVPGVGEDIAAWSSYAAAKRASKEKEQFGKGSLEGLMAAETGNNSAVPGAIIPVLTLQVPGSAPAAVLMAAMLIHGVRPGPMIMIESPQFVYDIVAMMLLATIGILIYGLTLTRLLVKVLRVPTTIIVPIILVLCTIGTFALASRLFDIWVMVAFGVLGFVLRKYGYPMAPLVLGIVLGDLLEKNFRRGLVLSDGDLTPFVTRPISAVLFGTIVVIVLLRLPAVRRLFSRKSGLLRGGA